MKIVYLSNQFHHHQKPLADCLYAANGDDYRFVEMKKELSDDRKKLGFTEYKEPYTIKYCGNEVLVGRLIMEADAVICGEAPVSLVKKRLIEGKLTFRDDERRYKNIFKYLKYPIYTLQSRYFNKGYLLSASAYGSRDYVLSGMKSENCFRWGYFTRVEQIDDIDTFINNKRVIAVKNYSGAVTILWAGRMISWKHPELPILVAKKLREDNLNFHINMIGLGYMQEKLQKYIEKYNLSEFVTILGQKGQDDVRRYMELSEIYLFTSDEGEGWGVVLSEAMASACVPVASCAAGSAPFLVKNGENGFLFKSESVGSLYKKVKPLIENGDLRCRLAKEAYKTMIETWNAKTASRNLMMLIESLKEGKSTPIPEGPCSQAPIINHTGMKV